MDTSPIEQRAPLSQARFDLSSSGGRACYKKHGKRFYKEMAAKATAARKEKARLRALEKERAEQKETA